ncbi:hypothetical protein ACOSQ4_010046 [Xanthoceras sorbifolium]
MNQRDPGRLPSQVIPNPKGNIKSAQAITLQSGRELGETDKEVEVDQEPKEKENAPRPATEISPKVSLKKKIMKEKDKTKWFKKISIHHKGQPH